MVNCDVVANLVALADLGFFRPGLGDPELCRSQIPPRTERREVTLAGRRIPPSSYGNGASGEPSAFLSRWAFLIDGKQAYLLELPSSPGSIRSQPL